uniref:Uncharacterized protein n=1 Tax=Arion vulgaris TaxID=1028688 RepID=A0A0B7A0U6_9EUPU
MSWGGTLIIGDYVHMLRNLIPKIFLTYADVVTAGRIFQDQPCWGDKPGSCG